MWANYTTARLSTSIYQFKHKLRESRKGQNETLHEKVHTNSVFFYLFYYEILESFLTSKSNILPYVKLALRCKLLTVLHLLHADLNQINVFRVITNTNYMKTATWLQYYWSVLVCRLWWSVDYVTVLHFTYFYAFTIAPHNICDPTMKMNYFYVYWCFLVVWTVLYCFSCSYGWSAFVLLRKFHMKLS